jgi:hypothetical protein
MSKYIQYNRPKICHRPASPRPHAVNQLAIPNLYVVPSLRYLLVPGQVLLQQLLAPQQVGRSGPPSCHSSWPAAVLPPLFRRPPVAVGKRKQGTRQTKGFFLSLLSSLLKGYFTTVSLSIRSVISLATPSCRKLFLRFSLFSPFSLLWLMAAVSLFSSRSPSFFCSHPFQ